MFPVKEHQRARWRYWSGFFNHDHAATKIPRGEVDKGDGDLSPITILPFTTGVDLDIRNGFARNQSALSTSVLSPIGTLLENVTPSNNLAPLQRLFNDLIKESFKKRPNASTNNGSDEPGSVIDERSSFPLNSIIR